MEAYNNFPINAFVLERSENMKKKKLKSVPVV